MYLDDVDLTAALSSDVKVAVAVSGGRDSMVLLDLARRQLGAERLVVLHFNHGLRAAAEDEQAFVQQQCRRQGIVCCCSKGALQSEGLSLEMAAREARYAFFSKEIQRQSLSALLMGHHGGDQAETVLMRLVAGTGVAGLSAMAQRRSLQPGVPILRPLLGVDRAAIDGYIAEHQLAYCEDESNGDETIMRNRIRHSLLPALSEINGSAAQHLCSLAEEAASLQEWLGPLIAQMMDGAVRDGVVDLAAFRELPRWPRREILRRYVIGLHCLRPTRERLAALDTFVMNRGQGGHFEMGQGLMLECSQNSLRPASAAAEPQLMPLPLAEAGPEFEYAGYFWQLETIADWQPRTAGAAEFFVRRSEVDALSLRTRAAGDYLRLGDENCTQSRHKKLQRYFMDEKIDRYSRDGFPLVAKKDIIVLVPGYYRDAALRPSAGDEVLCLRWRKK